MFVVNTSVAKEKCLGEISGFKNLITHLMDILHTRKYI